MDADLHDAERAVVDRYLERAIASFRSVLDPDAERAMPPSEGP
jgi:hypothetical protein